MSGVYIKGMQMPRACVYRDNGYFVTCPLYDIDGYCGALNREATHDLESRLCDCPLIPVPDHGRLIDADALEQKAKMLNAHYSYREVVEYGDIHYAPTIIPASGGE